MKTSGFHVSLIGLCLALALPLPAAEPASSRVPVIHCTDLYFPSVDVDDYYDLAARYAIPEIELKAILDHGKMQQSRPGTIPLSQMNRITGRSVPYAIGLGSRLVAPDEKALNQPEAYQGGTKLILEILRRSDRPVVIDAVGSMRDVAAAFNREPELFRRKVGKVFIFIGDADNPSPRNPISFQSVTESGPIP